MSDTETYKLCLRCKLRITCEAGHCDDCGATDCIVELPLWAVLMLEHEERPSDQAFDEIQRGASTWTDLTLESMRDLDRAYRALCETDHDQTKEAWDVFIDRLTSLAPDLIALGLSHTEAAERLRERVKGLTHGHVALDGLKRMLGYPDSAVVTGSTLGEPDVAFEELTIYHDGSDADSRVKNFEYGERIQLVVVEAPGDRCGGSRVLPDGTECPGCRACR